MTQERSESSIVDKFERARDSLWGQPGFQRRNTTVTSQGFSLIPTNTWVIETIRTDDRMAIFLQIIGADGGQRLVIPEKVCQAIINQYRSITKTRIKVRAKKAAETRKAKGIVPFQKKDS